MNSTASEVPHLLPGVRLSQDPLSGEPVLLYPEGYVLLNSTAYEVIARCNGQTTLNELVQQLAEEYQADPETLRPEIIECLHELRKLLVIRIHQEAE